MNKRPQIIQDTILLVVILALVFTWFAMIYTGNQASHQISEIEQRVEQLEQKNNKLEERRIKERDVYTQSKAREDSEKALEEFGSDNN